MYQDPWLSGAGVRRAKVRLLLLWPACGTLGPGAQHLFDFVYFSAVTFTTVGFGDLVPSGPIRVVYLPGDGALLAPAV